MKTPETVSSSVLRWDQVLELAQSGNVAPPRRVEKSDAEWCATLTDEQYFVTRRKGTERRFSSERNRTAAG